MLKIKCAPKTNFSSHPKTIQYFFYRPKTCTSTFDQQNPIDVLIDTTNDCH